MVAFLREAHMSVSSGTSEAEQEVTMRLECQEGQAHVCTTRPARSRRLEKLYGSPKKVSDGDGKATSAFWTIPLTAIRVGRPRRGRPVTEGKRQAVAARLRQAPPGADPAFGASVEFG